MLEIEPLGYHLGADQNIYFPFGELSQNPRFLLFVLGGVRVEAFYAGIWEECPQLFLYLLGAVSQKSHRSLSALGAGGGGRLRMSAPVAAQTVAELVVAHGNVAGGAAGYEAAVGAFHGRGVGSPGTEDEHLLMPFQPGGYGLEQSQGKCSLHGIPASLQGHVHDSDGAAAALEIAVGEGDVFQPAGAYVVQALEGGGSGTEEYRAALDPAQHQGGVPAVVAGSLVRLLVGLVVLFVHYDEAQAAVRQE